MWIAPYSLVVALRICSLTQSVCLSVTGSETDSSTQLTDWLSSIGVDADVADKVRFMLQQQVLCLTSLDTVMVT